MLDPMTSLAFSVYSGMGVYALLLGSGISRSTGIPTGWEIVEDLIRKVATVERKDCGEEPERWYLENFKKEPNYSELLSLVAPTPANRMDLLRGYFERDTDEPEPGKKAPSPAHYAIARLVADGFIRVIVTTNFDRLLEIALQSVGVVPSVISSTDSILGAKPLSQAKCTVIKLHGDYLDARLKNTSAEIGAYDDATNRLLDQVLDEYGLIICGWSAEWDIALRAAIERCPNRRYATYWSAYQDVKGHAEGLCQKRDAKVIRGMGADDFFKKLVEKVTALRDLDAPHPLSKKIAVATLKRYLAEDKDRIRLYDLVMAESGKVTDQLFGDLGNHRQPPTLREYEAKLETLLPLMAAAGYWGKASQRWLWLRCFQQMVTPKSGSLPGFTEAIDYYPVYILLYAFGISAIAGGRPSNLAYILAKGTAKNYRGDVQPLITRVFVGLDANGVLENAVTREVETLRGSNLVVSRHIFSILRDPLREWIGSDGQYEMLFQNYEYVIGLSVTHYYQKHYSGGFGSYHGLFLNDRALSTEIGGEINKRKERWPYLKFSLFDGSLDRLNLVKNGFDNASDGLRNQLHLL